MRKTLGRALLVFGIFVILEGMTFAASWVESKNQGMQIRHPQGWKVDWIEQGVGVFHPQDPMIWSVVRSEQFQGSSRQLAEEVVKGAASQVGEVKPLIQKQVSQRPDLYGIKFSGQHKGIPFTSLVLVVTEDRRNFVIREYSAPTKVYDEMKLTLVPILCSFCGQESGGAGGASASGGKGLQYIQSPHGVWRFTAPAGWKAPPYSDIRGEAMNARVLAPDKSVVAVIFDSAWSINEAWVRQRLGPNASLNPQYRQLTFLPYLPAAEVFQRISFPGYKTNYPDAELVQLKPINQQQVQYTIKFTEPKLGIKLVDEGMMINRSFLFAGKGDFNQITDYKIVTAEKDYPKMKDQLWQVLSSFEASPQFGSFVLQEFAKMNHQNVQATTNMALQNMQSNKQIMAQHVGIAQQKPAMMAQQGQGWINAVTGQEAVRDPQTGQKWQVPVGGQYIYGRNTGEVIRADRPISQQDMPEGFRQFEAVGIK
jgi:hypothetical protein